METMEGFPVEVWLMICELLQNFNLIPLYKSGSYLSWILSDTIFATELPRILPDLLKYLRMSDVVALRSTNGGFKKLVDNILENVENHSESRLFCRFVSAVKFPMRCEMKCGRNPLLGRGFAINVRVGESDEALQEFQREHGNRILKLKLVIEGNSAFEMRQQLHSYLGHVQNLRFLEIFVQIFVPDGADLPPDYSTMAGIFGAGVPVALKLPFFKDLIITTQIFHNGEIIAAKGIEDYFGVIFCPQRSQIRRITVPFLEETYYPRLANWFSWLTELEIYVQTVTMTRSGLQISSWKNLRIQKLTLFTDVQTLFTGDVAPKYSHGIVDCISNVHCFKETLTHLHISFRKFVRQDVFPLECSESAEMERLRQLTVTNGILLL